MAWGILFAIISNLSFGISNVYWKKAAQEDDISRVVFYRGVLAIMLFHLLLGFLLIGGFGSAPWVKPGAGSVREISLAFLLCSFCALGLVFFLRSLSYSITSVAVMLSSINIFSILTAVVVLGEAFRPVYFASFLLAATGVWLINRKNINTVKGWNRGVVFALLASFFWGVTYALFKYPANSIGALPLSIILETVVTITALAWNFFAAPKHQRIWMLPPGRQFRHYGVLALLLTTGTLFFNLAIQLTDVLLLNLLGNITLMTSVLLSYSWLKERTEPWQFAGMLLILLSLIVTQLA